ncbi:MAG: phosphatase PAP2-related protein, partial [Myxococcales bacterium]
LAHLVGAALGSGEVAVLEAPVGDGARDPVDELTDAPLAPALAGAALFRFGCYAVMTALALWAERRPAPSLPDVGIALIPYVPWVDRLNYVAWLLLYTPLTVLLLVSEPRRWVRYMVTGGLISLARGLCIAVTGLGPPDPVQAAGLAAHVPYWQGLVELLSPVDVFARGAARTYLTKDLFFSGHTATTFLVVLYLWHRPRLRWVALAAHVVVVGTVLVSHLHYTIDILGAYAVTFAIFALREWQPRTGSGGHV